MSYERVLSFIIGLGLIGREGLFEIFGDSFKIFKIFEISRLFSVSVELGALINSRDVLTILASPVLVTIHDGFEADLSF